MVVVGVVVAHCNISAILAVSQVHCFNVLKIQSALTVMVTMVKCCRLERRRRISRNGSRNLVSFIASASIHSDS